MTRASIRPARPAGAPFAVPSLIAAKRDGAELADADIRAIIAGASRGDIPDYQLSALLMAIVWRGMTTRELTTWTEAMIDSGERLRWTALRAPAVDKHSTGGVGDKISLALAPLCAACGLTVPMIAGRALGHTGGTLDKLEAIPGYRIEIGIPEFVRLVGEVGCAVVAQTSELVPADAAMYALRDVTGTVPAPGLIATSVMSKKVAEGARALVMDVKVGSGAFLPERARGRALARTLIALGRTLKLPVRAFLTDMDQPLGDAIGNAAEVREAIDVLRGGGPADTRALTVRLGAEMLVLGRVARDRRDGARRIEAAIASGAGLERFILGVRLQGGDPRAIDDPRRLPRARHTRLLRAPRSGVVTRVDAGLLGRAATLLGAGRLRKEDRIAFGAAILLHAKVGTRVARGDALATIEFDDDARERAARPLYERAFALGSRAPRPRPLVLEALG